jgi:tetratricopeptide (TPR) repeat protein
MGALRARKLALHAAIATQNLEQVRARFADAIQAAPNDWRLDAQWGEILLNAGLYGEAEGFLHRVVEALPHRIEMLSGLAMVLAYDHRAPAGAALYSSLPPEARPLVVEHMLHVSRQLMRDRHVEEAEVFASLASKFAPDDADVAFELARQALVQGRTVDGERILADAVARWPDHTASRNELSAVYAKQKKWAEAEQVLLKGAQDVDTRLKRVQLRMGAGDLDAADKQLRELEESGDDPGQVYLTRGIWLMIRQEPEPAVAAYKRSIEAKPDVRAYYELARALAMLGRTDEVRAVLVSGLELDPDNAACRQMLQNLGP